jgi:formylglycine-generating enzyme required for sulfatase activity
MQASLGDAKKLQLDGGVDLELVPIPAGRFVMGDAAGAPDEQPRAAAVDRPFYLSRCEITNEQFACFDPAHDSGVVSTYNKDASSPGLPMSDPRQPVARVSWKEAAAFCQWLSDKSGCRVRLPTEEEWEWACRAGNSGPMNYGSLESDFREQANLADRRLAALCRRDSPKWVPRVDQVDDGSTGPATVARYRPNLWGLHDMHGNLAEWTTSVFDPSGYLPVADDCGAWQVVRGGSFRSRPKLASSSYRCGYPAWLRVHDVGFRVVLEKP